jgi:ABC-type uncharacterized transport system substrate-binding protein
VAGTVAAKWRSVRVETLALTLLLLASSLAAVAQPADKVHRIGFLRHFACPDQFGLTDLRQKLVRLNIEVLVTEGTPASLAAKQATRLVPVIMVYVGDPVASGLVRSLGRPGGNITGVSMNANEIVSKDIELFKEIAPGISRVVVWISIIARRSTSTGS